MKYSKPAFRVLEALKEAAKQEKPAPSLRKIKETARVSEPVSCIGWLIKQGHIEKIKTVMGRYRYRICESGQMTNWNSLACINKWGQETPLRNWSEKEIAAQYAGKRYNDPRTWA